MNEGDFNRYPKIEKFQNERVLSMESIKLSFEAVMPIFLLMLVGYVIKRMGMADKKNFDTINKLVFKVFLPALLFYNIYSARVSDVLDVKLILFTVAGIIGVFVVGYFITLLVTKENAQRGVILQSFFRANFAILGIPLVKYICGEGSGALTSFMIVVVVPAFNILAVVAYLFLLTLYTSKCIRTTL